MTELEPVGHIYVGEELALLLDRIAQSDRNIGPETLARLITAKFNFASFARFLQDAHLDGDPDAIAILNLTQQSPELTGSGTELDRMRERREWRAVLQEEFPSAMQSQLELMREQRAKLMKALTPLLKRMRKWGLGRKREPVQPELMEALALALELALVLEWERWLQRVLQPKEVPELVRQPELTKALAQTLAQVLELAQVLALEPVQQAELEQVRALARELDRKPSLERELDREPSLERELDREPSLEPVQQLEQVRALEREPSLDREWKKE